MMKNKYILRALSLVLALVMTLAVLTSCEIFGGDITGGTSASTNGPASTNRPSGTSTTTTTTNKKDEWENYDSDHKDVDNDGYCDECNLDVVETIDFYNFNDLHGKFSDTEKQPGVNELTTFLQNAKETDEYTVIISTGDMWQGSGESNITKGALITDWMNYLGFEAMTIGNHEFDWGQDFIRANSEIAEFPFLAINIYDNATGERVDYCEASVMIERGGVKIGLIGAIGDCYSSILGEMTKGIHFKVGDALTELVKDESVRLRDAGADIVVYMIHDGENYKNAGDTSKYYDQSLSRGGYIDLVFEGHSHSYYVFEDNYGVPHLQAGGDNSKGIAHVEVEVNFANGEIDFNITDYVEHRDCSNLEDDPIVENLMDKYKEQIDYVNRELGYNSTKRSSDTIANLVVKLYYEAGVAKWGDQYDIVLAGGDINVRSPYDIPRGTVTYSQLQMILPFDNKLMLCSIKGKDLIEKFLNNSEYVKYSKITASQVDPNKTYYIIADSWTSSYAWANCTEIAEYDNETYARDLLAKYIEQGGWE